MTIIGHASEALFLPDTMFRSEAIGRDDIIRSVGGLPRVLYELLTGTNPFPDEPWATVRNPQSTHGHDHSGPPWGSAFRHPIAWWVDAKADTTNLQQPTKHPGASAFAGATHPTFGPFTFWNRPHAPLPPIPGEDDAAPYSRLFLHIVAHRGAANADLNVRLAVVDPETGIDTGQTDTLTITSATPAGYTTFRGSTPETGVFVPTRGGRNVVLLEFSSSAVSANAITIDAWALTQCVKDMHSR